MTTPCRDAGVLSKVIIEAALLTDDEKTTACTLAKAAGAEQEVPADPSGPLTALVFKTVSDPFVGRINLFRVFSGKVRPDSSVFNSTKNTEPFEFTAMP